MRAALTADEPVALLKGNLSSWSADDRKALVKSLLDAVESKRVTDSPYSNAEAYAKLNHPGLAAELRPFITDGQLNVTTRRLALLIAEKCGLTELQPELSRWRSMPPIIRRSGPAPCRRSNIVATPPSRTSSVLWWSAKAALILRMTSKATPSTCSGPITSQRPSSSRC